MSIDLGRLVTRTWEIFWNNRVLWILGFLVALGTNGLSVNYTSGPPPGSSGRFDEDTFMANFFAIFAVIVCLALVVGIVLSFVRAGGEAALITTTDHLARGGEAPSFAAAWKMGWPYALRLWLLYFVVAILTVIGALILFVPAVLVLFGGIAASGGGSSDTIGGAFAIFFCLLCVGVIVLIPASIILALVLQFAPRAIVLDNEGIMESIGTGWRLLRANVGPTLLTGLVHIGVSLAQGVVSIPIGVLVAAPAIFALYTSVSSPEGLTPGIIGSLIFFGLLSGLLISVVASVFTAFNSVLWTNLYRHLRQKPNGDLSPVPVYGGPYGGQQPPYGGQYNQQQSPYGGQQQPPYGGQYGGGTPTTQMPPYGQQQPPQGQPPYSQPPQQQPPYSGGFSVPGVYPESYQGGQPPASGGQSPTVPLGGSETYGPGPVQWGGSETPPEQNDSPAEGEQGRVDR